MPVGVIFALCAYAIYSCGDSIVKGLGGHLTVFEIGFFTACFSIVPAMIFKAKGERWRHTLRLHNPRLVHLRAVCGVISAILVTYAFTTIPLAEVYSLCFLAPVFVTVISVVVLKEEVSLQRWLLLMATFAGVLIVVRPGFRELHWGHLAAFGAAIASSLNTVILRLIAPREKRVSLFGVLTAYTIVINGVLMLPTFHWPTPEQLALVFTAGCTGGIGQLLFITATSRAPASQVAPAQYSQIVWAMIFGSVFYREFPDHVAIAGLCVVVLAGIANVISDDTRRRALSGFAIIRGKRPAVLAVPANDVEPVAAVAPHIAAAVSGPVDDLNIKAA
ncbi:MAG TPA: DMT family transporter [Devosiaceae bacterium]